MSTYSFAIPKMIINSLALSLIISMRREKMFKKFKEVALCLVWIIFIPFAYSIKILSYILFKIKKFFIMINNKIKDH